MTEKLHDTLGELYRGESYERSKPKRGEALDLEGSDLENIGDADADSVDADSVNTDGVGIDEYDVQLSDSQPTIYVRSDGDDSNDGRSPSEALATFDEAMRRIPRVNINPNGGKSSVFINVESGETFNVPSTALTAPWVFKVFVEPSSAGTPYTLAVEGGGEIGVISSTLYFEDVRIVPQDPSTPNEYGVRAKQGATINFRGDSEVSGASSSQVRSQDPGSYIEIGGSMVIDGTVDGTERAANGIVAYQNASVDLSSDITIQNAQYGVWADRNAAVPGAGTIDNCDQAIRAQDNSSVKIDGSSSEIKNCGTAFYADSEGLAKRTPGIPLTNNSYDYEVGLGGYYHDAENDTMIGPGELVKEGVVSVPGGGSANLNTVLGAGDPVDVEIWVENGPNVGGPQFEWRIRWDKNRSQQEIRIFEVAGVSEATDIGYRIYKR